MNPALRPHLEPKVSVVLCTYNRAPLLREALGALLRQRDAPVYEVLVIDNNSSDATRETVLSFGAGTFRYLLETRQGLSHARNHGIGKARGSIIAFTDDDVRVDPGWVRSIWSTFEEHPDVDFVGGRVLPIWSAPPPPWLHETGDSPLALVDYGDHPRRLDPVSPVCLVGANLAIRRAVFARMGGFATDVQRVGDTPGSTEDHELELRLLAAGRAGLYQPAMQVRAMVSRDRLRRAYHRAWHTGHGRHYARMREPAFERTRRSVAGVPGHVLRAAVYEGVGGLAALLRWRTARAFAHELRLRFLIAFTLERVFGHRHG